MKSGLGVKHRLTIGKGFRPIISNSPLLLTDISTSALAFVPDPSPFTSAEIESVLHNLPDNTAGRMDGVTYDMLKARQCSKSKINV